MENLLHEDNETNLPTEQSRGRDFVLGKLKQMLLEGELEEYDSITDTVLLGLFKSPSGDTYTTTRGTLREAMAILLNEGYLMRVENKKLRVKKYNAREKSEIVLMRILLEQAVVREISHKCSQLRSEADIKKLLAPMNECVHEMKQALQELIEYPETAVVPTIDIKRSRRNFFESDNSFHIRLAEAANMPLVAHTLQPLQAKVFYGGFPKGVPHDYMKRIIEEHQDILYSIMIGDSKSAENTMFWHIHHGGVYWEMESPWNYVHEAYNQRGNVESVQNTIPSSPDIHPDLLQRATNLDPIAALEIANAYRPTIKYWIQMYIPNDPSINAVIDWRVRKIAENLYKYDFKEKIDHWILTEIADVDKSYQKEIDKRIRLHCRARGGGKEQSSKYTSLVNSRIQTVLKQQLTPEENCLFTLRLCDVQSPKEKIMSFKIITYITDIDKLDEDVVLKAGYDRLVQFLPPLRDNWKDYKFPPRFLIKDYTSYIQDTCLTSSDFTTLFSPKTDVAQKWQFLPHLILCEKCTCLYLVLSKSVIESTVHI